MARVIYSLKISPFSVQLILIKTDKASLQTACVFIVTVLIKITEMLIRSCQKQFYRRSFSIYGI